LITRREVSQSLLGAPMKIQYMTSVAVVSPDPAECRKLFIDALGLPLKRHEGGDDYFSEEIAGARHFGVWPLEQAAEACFGRPAWPSDRPKLGLLWWPRWRKLVSSLFGRTAAARGYE
jgi:hypothetical protein